MAAIATSVPMAFAGDPATSACRSPGVAIALARRRLSSGVFRHRRAQRRSPERIASSVDPSCDRSLANSSRSAACRRPVCSTFDMLKPLIEPFTRRLAVSWQVQPATVRWHCARRRPATEARHRQQSPRDEDCDLLGSPSDCQPSSSSSANAVMSPRKRCRH